MGVLFAADEGRNRKEKAEMVVVLMVVLGSLFKELLPLGGDFRFCPSSPVLLLLYIYWVGVWKEMEIVSDVTTSSTGLSLSLSYTCALTRI